MTVELRPLGVKCNIQCQYCYQHPQRDAGNVPRAYDLDQMKAAIEQEGGPFALFGGEALLVPEKDLEDLWAWGLEKYQKNSVQTNGTLINDTHIRLFKRYKVGVGISIDGPGPLNDVRWAGTLERTREATAKTEAAIQRLCQAGIPLALIVTLHRGNATAEKLPIMHEWFKELEHMGVYSVRLHILETESETIREHYALTPEENLTAFLSFGELERTQLSTLKLDVFEDIRNMLRGRDDLTSCVWNACDPYTTRAVRGVEGHGQRSNCGRTNKDGIDFVKSDQEGYERYMALYHTPQEAGGCQGCRFFLMCKGQCPGNSIDGDWRNRSQDCEVWKGLFAHVEEDMIQQGEIPLSICSHRPLLERQFLGVWARGQNARLCSVLDYLSQSSEA